MTIYQMTITPKTPFSSLIKGDTLFGYACWEYMYAHDAHGKDALDLDNILRDYAHTPPFVVSDAFPKGYIPRPQVPSHMLGLTKEDPSMKKKKKIPYCAVSDMKKPINEWLSGDKEQESFVTTDTRTHNRINRKTCSTDEDFAPYNKKILYLNQKLNKHWHIYIVLPSNSSIDIDTVGDLIKSIGQMGYGGGKTRGMGKFAVDEITAYSPPVNKNCNAFLTLAPHISQGGTNTQQCYYKPFTRFGKMGDMGALSQKPFKSPILMINTGAIITPQTYDSRTEYIGQGIGGIDDDGKGKLSESIPQAVHQGYSPVIPVYLEDK